MESHMDSLGLTCTPRPSRAAEWNGEVRSLGVTPLVADQIDALTRPRPNSSGPATKLGPAG
jgi:hypothetical protein